MSGVNQVPYSELANIRGYLRKSIARTIWAPSPEFVHPRSSVGVLDFHGSWYSPVTAVTVLGAVLPGTWGSVSSMGLFVFASRPDLLRGLHTDRSHVSFA
jgi:hypothetical protein